MNKDLDYSLLKVLLLLNKHRSLKKVALILGKTEGTISKYLSKLRAQIGDPLFVRTREGLEPTPALILLLPSLEEGLNVIDSAVFTNGNLSLTNYTKTIRVALQSSIISIYSYEIYKVINKEFPNSFISLELWTDSTEQNILDGKIDIGVHFIHGERKKDIYQSKLINTSMVVGVSPDSPINTWKEASLAPHIFFKINDSHHSRRYFVEHCLKNGIALDYKVNTDSFETAMALVSEQGMAVVGLKRLLRAVGLKVIEIPEELQVDISLVSCIKLLNRGHPLQVKLKELIKGVIK